MALQPLSVGDILMLSQQAWKIGRAFTQGRNSAPAEFAEVEREANGLSDSLKLTAETLHADGSILSRAEPETRTAVNAILESAGRTLGDLESFVERYQVIKKRNTDGGFVVEKSWSEVIIANYKTFKWTTEGGNISDLRNVLQVHTNTINLTMQALQSRSLSRLERTVMPMADEVASIHDRVNGDLGNKIDDLHRIIMSIANSTPSLVARDRLIDSGQSGSTRSSHSAVSSLDHESESLRNRHSAVSALDVESDTYSPRMLEAPPPRLSSFAPVRASNQHSRTPRDSAHSTPTVMPGRFRKDESTYPSSDMDFEAGSPPRTNGSVGNALDDGPSSPASTSRLSPTSANSHRRESQVPRRESSTLPNLFQAITEDAEPESSRDAASEPSKYASSQHNSSPTSPSEQWSSHGQPVLPPPAIASGPTAHQSPATPSTFFNASPRRTRSTRSNNSDTNNRYSRPRTPKSSKGGDGPPSPALSTMAAFEKQLFRNAAILCDVRATLIEYAQKNLDEPDPRYDTEMVEACKEARVVVIRKRENREHGGTKLATSIWTLSTDGLVRCQQKLREATDTVPFCSYFQPEKVSIAEGGDMDIKFHGEKWGDLLEKQVKSNWVNYIFASENDAVGFQSAVFGRMLIGSFRTTKTTVIHEGMMSAFAFEEQFANIETLRLWEEDGVSTPGAQGGVLALMHISSNFGDGWARWWMNCSKQHVRVKGEGWKHAKVKGIDITVVKPGAHASTVDKIRNPAMAGEVLQRINTGETMSMRGAVPSKKIPVKRVTGVKIEFKTEEERLKFVNMSQKVQERLIPLPDL